MLIDVIVSGLSASPVDGTRFFRGRSIFTYHTDSAGLLEVALLWEAFLIQVFEIDLSACLELRFLEVSWRLSAMNGAFDRPF